MYKSKLVWGIVVALGSLVMVAVGSTALTDEQQQELVSCITEALDDGGGDS